MDVSKLDAHWFYIGLFLFDVYLAIILYDLFEFIDAFKEWKANLTRTEE